MTKQTQKKYINLIKKINSSGLITKKEINRIKNALSRDYSIMSEILSEGDFASEYAITSEQKIKGAKYLAKKHSKRNGAQRKTSTLGEELIDLIRAIQNGSKYDFTFNGFKEITNGFFNYYAPIYTLKVNGESVAYFHYNGNDYEKETNSLAGCICCYDY